MSRMYSSDRANGRAQDKPAEPGGMLKPKFSRWRGTDMVEENVSDLDDPLAHLYEAVEEDAIVEIVKLDGYETLNVKLDDKVTVSPEEHDMKTALLDYRDVLLEMVNFDEEEWPDVLDRHGVEDENRREQLQLFAESARE